MRIYKNEMELIKKILNKQFVIFDMGSSYGAENSFLKKFGDQLTFIEIDALQNSEIGNKSLFKNIKINKGIHSEAGIKKFIERNYLQCSSFLEFKDGVGEMYGIEEHIKTKQIIELDCITVDNILQTNDIATIDFLKTDIEGLDFEIIKSINHRLSDINVIKSELRFQPLFKNEAPFYEICSYLAARGFELINFTTLEDWKLNTRNQKNYRDGRMVWGDFVFFRILNPNEPNYKANIVKQIIIAKSLNFNSYSEYLLEKSKGILEHSLYKELEAELNTFSILELFFNKLFRVLSYTPFIYPIRKSLKYLYQRTRLYLTVPQGI